MARLSIHVAAGDRIVVLCFWCKFHEYGKGDGGELQVVGEGGQGRSSMRWEDDGRSVRFEGAGSM